MPCFPAVRAGTPFPPQTPATGASSSAGPFRGSQKVPTQKINDILAHLLLFVFHRAFGRDFLVVLPHPPHPPPSIRSQIQKIFIEEHC